MITEGAEHVAVIQRRLGVMPEVAFGDDATSLGFTNYTGDDIEIFMVTRQLTRRVIQLGFLYVFDYAGCKRCTIRVDLSNKKSRDIVARLGFVREGRLRQAHNGEDVLVFGMLKSECRWLHGRKKSTGPASGSRHQRDVGDAGAIESS